MPSSPLVEETNAFTYTITSGGSDIPANYEVMNINITQEVNKIGSAEITFRDGSAASQTFDISDADTFKPGAEIEIKLGYKSQNESVFKGVVTKQSINIDEGSVSRLQVSVKDKAVALTKIKNTATFLKMKDSDLISQIVSNSGAGLSATVDATTLQYARLIQSESTDWDFINLRAAQNGMFVSTEPGKIIVAKPKPTDSPELQVQFGYDIIEFDTEIDGTNQYDGVECSAWSPKDQKMISAQGEKPKLNQQGNLSESDLTGVVSAGTLKLKTSGSMTQEELKNWATSKLELLSLSRFVGSVSFNGSTKAKVNSTIKLMGLSDRFNGNSFITGINHTINGGKWVTKASIGIPPEAFEEKNDVSSPSASGLVPGINGLQTGIVTKTDSDPDNEFRVQVSLPILGDDSDPIWARLSTFYASNSFGAYFMPEVNDEVILGFMNDDPTFPVILGSVYSSKLAAPETPDEKNTIKTLITQSKLQVKFDDENKVITILTPGGNTLVLSDQDKGITATDQNNNKIETNDSGITVTDKSSNKIEMTSSGITVNSQSDLTLKAAQGVSIQGMTVEVKGDTSVKASSASVEISADSSAKMSGNASCNIESSGQTSIKGSMVNIN